MRFLGKFIERAMWFYPTLQIAAIGCALVKFIQSPSWKAGGLVFFLVYLLSPLLYQIIRLAIPIKTGRQQLGPEQDPSGWMIAHRLQMIYLIFPFIEGVLNSLPGIYSNWLKLWGSKIGRMVYWAPDVKILDRTHLTVGDRTFVGGAVLSCHLAIPKKEGIPELVFQPITIGSDVFISTQSNLGPGSRIADKEHIKILTQVYGTKRRELV
jgi:hypothetical protein